MTRPPLSRGSREHPLTRAPHVIVLRHDSLTRLLVVHRGFEVSSLCVFISCWDFPNPQRSIVPSGSGA
jgi:hypothetical protein